MCIHKNNLCTFICIYRKHWKWQIKKTVVRCVPYVYEKVIPLKTNYDRYNHTVITTLSMKCLTLVTCLFSEYPISNTSHFHFHNKIISSQRKETCSIVSGNSCKNIFIYFFTINILYTIEPDCLWPRRFLRESQHEDGSSE